MRRGRIGELGGRASGDGANSNAYASRLGDEEPELTKEEKRAHKKAVKAIVKELDTEKNQMLVKGRIEALGSEGTRVARDALMLYVKGNKNHEFVQYSFYAIAKIGGKLGIEYLCGKEALRARNFLVQHAAAEALAIARDPRATGPLLDVMTGKRTKIKIVGACALALAKSSGSDERVVEVLFKQSRHNKDTIRAYTLEALGYLATDEAIQRLEEALFRDKNTRCRGSAATGMKNSGRRDTIPMLKKAIAESNAMTVKDACMQAITHLEQGA